MTNMYDEPKIFQGGDMDPYPHSEAGVERGRVKDPVGYLQATEQRARERQVAYETVKILRQRLIECYRKEGVNHYEDCRGVAKDYYDTISKKDLGQLHPNWANPEKHDGW